MCGELGFCGWVHKYNKRPVFDGKKFMLGDRILGVRNIHSGEEVPPAKPGNLEYLSSDTYKDITTGLIYKPLSDMTDVEIDELSEESRQIIF